MRLSDYAHRPGATEADPISKIRFVGGPRDGVVVDAPPEIAGAQSFGCVRKCRHGNAIDKYTYFARVVNPDAAWAERRWVEEDGAYVFDLRDISIGCPHDMPTVEDWAAGRENDPAVKEN